MVSKVQSRQSAKQIDDRPSNNSSHELMMLLRTAYFALRRKCNQICSEFNSNGDQFVILSVLFEQDRGVTQQFLAEQTGYDPATTGTMLKSMEERELVERIPHPHDGRAKLVTISRQGKLLFQDLWVSSNSLRHEFLNCLTAKDQKNVFRMLQSIADSMESFEHTR